MAHNEHVGEVMRGVSSPEFVGWIEYFKLKDEITTNRLVYAIARAFNGDKNAEQQVAEDKDDEEVIDTTDPDFVKYFQGFTGTPGGGTAPSQNRAQMQAQARTMGTQIIMG